MGPDPRRDRRWTSGCGTCRTYYADPQRGKRDRSGSAWDDPDAWDGNSSGGVYRLTFANQVTIRPIHADGSGSSLPKA